MFRTAVSALLLVAIVFGLGGFSITFGLFALWLIAINFNGNFFNKPLKGQPAQNWGAVIIVTAILALVFFLRWPIASHDIEHYVGPDEGEVVENVLEMIRMQDFDHRHRGYPGLHFYIQRMAAEAQIVLFGVQVQDSPREVFYLLARRVSLVAGVLTGLVVFLGMARYLSLWSTVIATSLVSFSPLLFRESANVNPDLVLMFFVTLSLVLSLRLLDSRNSSDFFIAGVSIALASAIKYTGIFTVAPYVVASLLGNKEKRDIGKFLCGGLFSAVVFVFVSPYTFLNFSEFVKGVSMHAAYYQAAELNAPLELTRQLAMRGVSIPAALLAFGTTFIALKTMDRRVLVVSAYPLTYLVVFSFFDRAYPRHALVLVPFAAVLAANGLDRLSKHLSNWIWKTLCLAVAIVPAIGTIDLSRRVGRQSTTDLAASWVREKIPPGARVLQDQQTPALNSKTYKVHRLSVEERAFLGNYDWVMHSGYPPGLSTIGLRKVAHFANNNTLGSLITVYEVPDRSMLMGKHLGPDEQEFTIGAGELPYFGDGWYPPTAGAFETSRLSQGYRSELFFVLEKGGDDLQAELILDFVSNRNQIELSLNDRNLEFLMSEDFHLGRVKFIFDLPAEITRLGLNHLQINYRSLTRLGRRHRETAIKFYNLQIKKH